MQARRKHEEATHELFKRKRSTREDSRRNNSKWSSGTNEQWFCAKRWIANSGSNQHDSDVRHRTVHHHSSHGRGFCWPAGDPRPSCWRTTTFWLLKRGYDVFGGLEWIT